MPSLRRAVFNRTLYLCVYTLFTLLYNFCYVSRIMNYVANGILVVWGLIFLVHDLLGKRLVSSHRLLIPFISFLAVYVISVLINVRHGFFENGYLFLLCLVEFFVLCSYDLSAAKDDVLREIKCIALTAIAASFPLSAGSLVLFAGKMKVKAYGNTYGFVQGRLYGFYTNPNSGSMVAFFSIALAIMLMIIWKGRFKKLLITNILVQFLYLALALSRGSQAALIVFGLFFSFFLSMRRLRVKDIRRRIAAGLGVAILSVTALGLALEVSRLGLSYIPETVSYVEKVIEKKPASIAPVPIERDYSKGFFAPRSTIWRAGLSLFLERPVFGVGYHAIPSRIKPYLSKQLQSHISIGGLHNNYLQVLVAVGAAGLLAYLFILAVLNATYVRYLLDCLRRRRFPFALFGCITGLSTALFIYNLVESKILLDNCIVSTMFWVFSGYALYFCLKGEDKKAEQPEQLQDSQEPLNLQEPQKPDAEPGEC